MASFESQFASDSDGFKPKQRAATLRTAVQEVLTRGLSDPRLDHCMVTVTEVDLSPDGRNATIKISVIPEKYQTRAIAAIQHASAHIRRHAGDRLSIKLMPQLSFVLDISLKKQAAVMDAISKVVTEREQTAPPAPDAEPPADALPADGPPAEAPPADDAPRST